MKFRIEECEICGIMNPTLVIRGWADSSVDHIVIKSKKEILTVKKLNKIRAKIVSFDFKIPLNNNKSFEVYLQSNGGDNLIETVQSTLIKRVWQKYKPRGIAFNKFLGFLYDPIKKEIRNFNKGTLDMHDENEYNIWLKENSNFLEVQTYNYQPKISIVMPVYNVPAKYLSYCIESILKQTYQNFEICIADDCSTNQETIQTLKAYQEKDNRIKVVFRKENGHISRATNSALALASGEFIGLMDNDDTLDPHALNEVVHVLNENYDLDFIYTDEDKIDMEGKRSDPHFKPDFSLDTLYGGNYICHFSVIRKTIIDRIGGFRVGYEGAQDFDLFLRVSNETTKIYHIAKILYHWRMIPGSTAVGGDGAKNYAGEAGKRALEDYFKEKNIDVNIDNVISTQYFVEYVLKDEPIVDILTVFDGNAEELDSYLNSIYTDNAYNNFNVIILNKNKELIERKYSHDNIKFFTIEDNIIESINNYIENTNAEYIIFANENCIFETYDWINLMIGYAKQDKIGAVGCKILDKNYIVRNAGIVINDQTLFTSAYGCTSRNDYGNYGRLLVPYNYSIVGSDLLCIKKSKISKLDTSFDLNIALYDLCLRLLELDLRNIVLPQVEVVNKKFTNTVSNEIKEIFYNKNKIHFLNDKYYNNNLSKEKAFRLEDNVRS